MGTLGCPGQWAHCALPSIGRVLLQSSGLQEQSAILSLELDPAIELLF